MTGVEDGSAMLIARIDVGVFDQLVFRASDLGLPMAQMTEAMLRLGLLAAGFLPLDDAAIYQVPTPRASEEDDGEASP